MPRALMRAPQRRSMVSSIPMTTSPFGSSRSIISGNNRRATARASQRARLSTS
jgi:hypothetical protein